ncbi:MAG: GAF domain-containing sensor histidine kinase [Phycisphaerales bacterium]|nr:GAF domain-containing sensor histidine kinase [Phycisphaerales bacterium]
MSWELNDILFYVDTAQVQVSGGDFSDKETSILDSINQRVAAAESLSALADFLFEATRNIYPCDRLGLAFIEEDGRRVVSRYVRSLYEPVRLPAGYAEDLRGSTLEEILHHDRLRIIRDLEAYHQARPDSRSTRLLVREGVRSSMTCPLKVEGRNVGLLFRSSRRPNDYDLHQARLHQAIAERLSQAVEKAYRLDQLTAANRAYNEMLGFVSHELKSPVASMVTQARLFLDGYLGDITPRQREQLARMVTKGEYLIHLVGEYLDLARLEGGELQGRFRKDVDFLSLVVDPSIDIVTPQMEPKGMQLDRPIPEKPIMAELDPDLMKIVLVNLLSNAVKYGREKGMIRIKLEQYPDRLSVSVWNEGPGFPESEQNRLFRKFSRLQTPELLQQKGTGVGLYTCWRIIQLHHGRIRARSEPGQWAEFYFEIPQPLPTDEMPA